MEDHSHAYSFWKEQGLSNGICVHVDAHLDLMDRGFTPEMLQEIAKVQSAEDLKHCATPTYLPWGGVHCGNYLFPALMEGIVTHLIWVVPKAMVEDSSSILAFAHAELPNWMDLTLEEHNSLRLDGPRVEGVLAGQRFTLCTSDSLPALDQRPILLDIDVDYFQDAKDRIWQTPGGLRQELGLQKIDALTIAVSVDGGYTCLEHRYLGEVIEEVFTADSESPWEERTRELIEADLSRLDDPHAYNHLGRDDDPNWFKATLELKQRLAQGLSVQEACESAAGLDSRYQAVALNEALCHLRVGLVEEAISLSGDSVDSLFVKAIITFQGGRFDLSKDCWNRFLDKTELSPKERAFALFTRSQATAQVSPPESVLGDLLEATKLDPDNYQYALFCGLILQITGDHKKAAKIWRKALNKCGDRLASLGLHLELSRLYRSMGKQALANAELQRVAQKDQTGEFKMMIQLEHLRSSKLKPTLPEPKIPGLFAAPIMAGGLL